MLRRSVVGEDAVAYRGDVCLGGVGREEKKGVLGGVLCRKVEPPVGADFGRLALSGVALQPHGAG